MKGLLDNEAIRVLSPGEQRIMALMKNGQQYSAAEIYILLGKKSLASSSVSVLLDRLHKKGSVTRETQTARGGIRFLYTLEQNQERFEQSVINKEVRCFVKKFGNRAIAYFNESLRRLEGKP